MGWLDETKRPQVRAWIRKQLADKMGKDYSFDVSVDSGPIPEDYRLRIPGIALRIQYMATVQTTSRHHLTEVRQQL